MLIFSQGLISNIRNIKLNPNFHLRWYCLLVSLLLVNLGADFTRVSAQQTVNNMTPFQISPHQLVFLAYRGYFLNQGISSYTALIDDYIWGRITSKDLVNAAIKTNILPANFQTDSGYLNSVDAFLKDLNHN
ncbi:hypothetical protein [Calothrix sp. NIES-3974]|uniref:hypothetical protein n=1 Tax=Calothrix sp. NIES-3974 TaxID=2005462 RepID=UPI000B60B20D|nr:hypothetical protein [Calothrix sp. NIES-3974]BAZ04734.1 hypothetical protein NIES3974_13770 [Calothrix sp. NIES-3974]